MDRHLCSEVKNSDFFFKTLLKHRGRQWPGNIADLDFRGVISKCSALIVAMAPHAVPKLQFTSDVEDYYLSKDYELASSSLPFLRLWCIGSNKNNLITYFCIRF